MEVDVTAFIQCHQHPACTTFHELQVKYLKKLLIILPDNCDGIHLVGDRYGVSPAESLKGEERVKRMNTCPNNMKDYKPHNSLALPEWKNFIRSPLNKANLLNYLGEAWAAQKTSLPAGSTIIPGGVFRDPGHTLLLSASAQVELPELSCKKHEAADMRMFAHITYSVQHLWW